MKNKILVLLSFFISAIFFTQTLIFYDNTQVFASDNQDTVDLVILFDNNIDINLESEIVKSGGKIKNRLAGIGGIEVECNQYLIPEILKYNSVQSIAPNHVIKLQDEEEIDFNDEANYDLYNKYQWDIKRITNNGESFKLSKGDHSVLVGIIDSGVKSDHNDLKENFMGGSNFVTQGFNGDESESGDINDFEDRMGHGTYVAGDIAANGRVKGVAPCIGFKSYRVFDEQGNTNAVIVSSAIMKAVEDGVKVINLSINGYDLKGKYYWYNPETKKKYKMGNDMAEYELYKKAIKYAIKNNVVVITSSGNDGLDCGNKNQLTEVLSDMSDQDNITCEGLTYAVPGTIKGVVNVSATGEDDSIEEYSNYGDKFIDVAAPGGDENNLCLSTGISESGYVFGAGTSIAAPKVAAIAALILCQNKNINYKDVAKIIYKSSNRIGNSESEKYYGAGIANAYKALVECKTNKKVQKSA